MNVDFQSLFESAPSLYLVLTPDFKIVAATDAYLDATMTDRAQILGRNLFEVFPDNPNDLAANGVSNLRASLGRVLENGATDAMPIQKYDVRQPLDRGGKFEARYWSPSNAPIFDDQGRLCYILHKVVDVTDLISGGADWNMPDGALAMSKVRQAQRMEAMGQLAGGVAHDFNNILSIIMMNCELIGFADVDETVRRRFEQIQRVSERAAALTRQLLAFSRRQILQPKAIELNSILGNLEGLLSRLITVEIKLKMECGANLPQVWLDPGQVEQIVINLVVNARDAIASGGEILLRTDVVELSAAWVATLTPRVAAGKFVRLSVRDNGAGMSDETMSRLFEPFFTTKEVGKGTGLGLATVHGIVEQSGGTLAVKSQLGQGSEFEIFFPPYRGEVAAAPPSATSAVVRGSILVVEDQTELRELISETLTLQGYTVCTAENGSEALALVEKSATPIDLVITDVVMPEMSGPVLARELEKRQKPPKILYLSGYDEGALSEHGLEQANFLEKPFPRHSLLEKVNKILTEKN